MIESNKNECSVCGKPVKLKIHAASGICNDWRCRQQVKLKQRIQRRGESLQRNLERATNLLKRSDPTESDRGGFRPVIIPANERRLINQPRRRRYRFTKRLLRLFDRMDSIESEELANDARVESTTDDDSELLPIYGAACGTCGGRCCRLGGTHAFLDREAVKRTMKALDTLDPIEVVAAYVQRLPEKAFAGSCVFHSESGCTLDREMRSNTCNNTLCAGLVELRNRVELDGETRFFLAAANDERIVRTHFVNDESGIKNSDE